MQNLMSLMVLPQDINSNDSDWMIDRVDDRLMREHRASRSSPGTQVFVAVPKFCYSAD